MSKKVLGVVFPCCPGCWVEDAPLCERIYSFQKDVVSLLNKKLDNISGCMVLTCEACFHGFMGSKEFFGDQINRNIVRMVEEGMLPPLHQLFFTSDVREEVADAQ